MKKDKTKKEKTNLEVKADMICPCGASLENGAILCSVCKALYDRDKRKSKARAKAKTKKVKKAILKDPEVQDTIQSLLDHAIATLDQFGDTPEGEAKKAVVTAMLAYQLNLSLPTVEVEVRSSLVVEGEDSGIGWTYQVHKA